MGHRRMSGIGMLLVATGILAAVFLVQYYQLGNARTRAAKLYEDSWFVEWREHRSEPMLRTEANHEAVRKLDEALKLSPGNSLYEQALVWRYDRKDLPKLLKERKLSQRARQLAYGVLSDYDVPSYDYSAYGGFDALPDADHRQFARATELVKHDPGNAIAHYLLAYTLERLGRHEEAFREVQAGSRAPEIRWYMPEVPMKIRDTMAGISILDITGSRYNSKLRQLARDLSDMGIRLLQAGLVEQACEPLEESCRMAVRVAGMQNSTYTDYLSASYLFRIGWSSLEPIYKDYGMREELERLAPTARVFSSRSSSHYDFDPGSAISQTTLPMFFSGTIMRYLWFSLIMLMLSGSAISWEAWKTVLREKSVDPPDEPPWGGAWLVKMTLAVFAPFFAVSAAILYYSYLHPSFTAMELQVWAEFLPVIALLVAELLLVRRQHHFYVRNIDSSTGWWRFSFKAAPAITAGIPMKARLWDTAKMIPVITAILVCGYLFSAIVTRSVFGVYPRQWYRYPRGTIAKEIRLVHNLQVRVDKVAPPEWKR